tara:strand:+ start:493 stop:675 length:183 start_codon:yes stop_codon:yes gene_type:complete
MNKENNKVEYLPIPNIKSSLKKHNKKNINKTGKKKKYLDSILNSSFINTYFKKKELKLKH